MLGILSDPTLSVFFQASKGAEGSCASETTHGKNEKVSKENTVIEM